MEKEELLRHVGSMQQLAGIRAVTINEGRASGLRTFQVHNGPLSFQVLADKCLDIGEFSYAGVNLNFLSKPGLQGRGHYDTNGDEALRSIMGGLFFTAGLENICAPCTVNGKDYPMHGRIRTTPGEHLSSDAAWKDGSYVISCSGEMREAELFGENLVLRRTIETVYGQKSVSITDVIENQGCRSEPLMLLYHINFGYPLLDERTELVLPTRSVTPRDEASAGHETRWNLMDAPRDNEPEYVFIHDLIPDRNGCGQALVLNHRLGLGVKLTFTMEHLTRFMEWKSTASGDYVLGLEPSNSCVYGRPWHEREGDLHHLAPFARETSRLTFTVLDGREEMARAKDEVLSLFSESQM